MSTRDSKNALPFVFVDYASSPEDALAEDIIKLDRANPADLSQTLIWCGSRTEIHRIKLSLMRAAKSQGIAQLILPSIMPLEDWVWQQAAPTQRIISEDSKQLILVEALRGSINLFQTNNPWPLAKELVDLFNECTQALIPLNEGQQAFNLTLQKSYRYTNKDTSNISRESEIVHRLWIAYHEEIEARDCIDPIHYYCQWLVNNEANYSLYSHYFITGKHRFNAAEGLFLDHLSQSNNLSIYTTKISPHSHVTYHHPHLRYSQDVELNHDISDSRELALDIIYQRTEYTFARIQRLIKYLPENVFRDWISLYTCNSIENHVNAICLQAKKWLLEATTAIGIIVNDRLLARRIRAVLEEQGIQPNDLGGWTLSTTSAATVIDILLDAIESNFKKDSLLDLLSSPFIPYNNQADCPYINQTYTLKKYLKKHRNSATDNLDVMLTLAVQCFDTQDNECIQILQTINASCKTLLAYKQSEEHTLHHFTSQLVLALNDLGIHNTLESDIAGQQLIDTLDNHTQNIRANDIKVTWKEWRQWLTNLFEHNYFIPPQTDKRITLCTLEQTEHLQFDAAIIAGVEDNRLLERKQRTFFNEKVCYELNLPTSHETNAINFVRFRKLLQHTSKVLLSAEQENHGEPQEICSWVKLIELFSQQAYATSINTSEIDLLLQAYKINQATKHDFTSLKTLQPKPNAPADLIPSRISATQYQSLIDCPYQYFAKYILALRDIETADEFEASDYGKLVHQCLHDFHFSEQNNTSHTFNSNNSSKLVEQLSALSTSVFMHAAFPNTVKQAWLQRWLTNVPAYIDWAIERAKQWRPMRGESLIQTQLNARISLYGQIDRIDSDTQNIAVIDYKTSSSKPTKKSVINGELVQLPFYALLDDNIIQAEYLSLGTQGEIKSSASINADELAELKSEHLPRLEYLLNELVNEANLTAQGDDYTCGICEYQGLCRKQHWN